MVVENPMLPGVAEEEKGEDSSSDESDSAAGEGSNSERESVRDGERYVGVEGVLLDCGKFTHQLL